MVKRLWMQIVGSLKTKTSLSIAGVMTALLVIFVVYDVSAQRRALEEALLEDVSAQQTALEEALLQKGRSMAVSGATAVGYVFENAIAGGQLTEAELFDTDYQPIPGTDPQKYHTAYDDFTDVHLLAIEDVYLQDEDVLYAVALDVNAYVPTHNTRYAEPLTGDYETDLKGNRTKRIFTEEPIRNAAANTDPILHEVYHRDTGEVVWNVSTPVWVNGKHWGGFLVGFSLDRVEAIETSVSQRVVERVDDIAASASRRVVMAALALVVVIFVLAFFVARSIANPILALHDVAIALADGDLTQEVQVGSRSRDEVGELVRALSTMVVAWREIVTGLRDDAVRLSTTAAELAASSEELSRTTAAQSDEISRTASATEEVAASIREVARHAEQAARAATASSQQAQAGGKLTADTAAGLAQADEIMQQLRARSNEIGKIVSLIQEVAAQTNILALNAAIEAAGAGVAGARFDVVAEEIRKLAGRTSQATGEIAELIGAVQTDTQAAAEAISRGAAMAKESGASLADIVGSSASVNDMVQSISAATSEQSQASEEIANSIDTMVDGSQQTATATRETAQIGVELSNLAERLKDAADQFRV